MKHVPRSWFAKSSKAVELAGFIRASLLLFIKRTQHGIALLLVYVDYIVIVVTGDHMKSIKDCQTQLRAVYDIKDLGKLKSFLRIGLASKGIVLSQRKYALDLLPGLLGSKPCAFPIEQNHKLSLEP